MAFARRACQGQRPSQGAGHNCSWSALAAPQLVCTGSASALGTYTSLCQLFGDGLTTGISEVGGAGQGRGKPTRDLRLMSSMAALRIRWTPTKSARCIPRSCSAQHRTHRAAGQETRPMRSSQDKHTSCRAVRTSTPHEVWWHGKEVTPPSLALEIPRPRPRKWLSLFTPYGPCTHDHAHTHTHIHTYAHVQLTVTSCSQELQTHRQL